ncbi:hypothetical protein ACLOJK_034085 [Asimina triloba]
MVKKTWSSDHHRLSSSSGCSSKKKKMNKGAWTTEEDQRLVDYVKIHGEKKWASLPAQAGLNRCGKSCRLRWLNYLKPGIKRGNISEDEEDLIIRLHNLIGNRLPGRTDNEIKNHWNTHLSKKSLTINQLNWKLNQNNQISSDPSPTLIATNGSDLAAPSRNEWTRSQIFQPSERPNGSDGPQLAGRSEQQDDGDFFDVNGLLDFSSMVTDVAESEPLNVGMHGSDDTIVEQQFTCNQPDLERLARWMEHEDDVFAFLSRVWQP